MDIHVNHDNQTELVLILIAVLHSVGENECGKSCSIHFFFHFSVALNVKFRLQFFRASFLQGRARDTGSM